MPTDRHEEANSLFNPSGLDTGWTDEQLEQLVYELTQAERNHREWLKRLNRSLISGAPHATDVLSDESHFLCRFGRWYYHEASALVRHNEDFIALGNLHETMHHEARELALASMEGWPIDRDDYDLFADHQTVFFETVHRLRDSLRDSLMAFDGLTGARTRQSFVHVLEAELARMKRQGCTSCLAVLDLDHFKSVNDEYGHLAGDRVLRDVALAIQQQLRPYDTLCRFGGDEFVICLPDVTLDDSRAVLNRIREAVAGIEWHPDPARRPVSVTLSVGVAELTPHGDVESSFQAADDALYDAKGRGRNAVVVAAPTGSQRPASDARSG